MSEGHEHDRSAGDGNWWTRLKGRLKALMDEYGPVALVVWFTIFGAVWVGFAVAIESGFQPADTGGETAKWALAYGLTQGTKPLRILATLALTPVVARVWRRFRGQPEATPVPEPEEA